MYYSHYFKGISSPSRLTIPRSFAEQVQAPDVTCWDGSRVSNMERQGCGTPSLETIKLSPLYLCGGTTKSFSPPLQQHHWWDLRLPSHSASELIKQWDCICSDHWVIASASMWRHCVCTPCSEVCVRSPGAMLWHTRLNRVRAMFTRPNFSSEWW